MKKSTKYLKISVNILGMAALLAFCIWVLPRILVYFMPFVVAGIIALIANPLVKFMESRIKIARRAGTAMVIVIVIALVVLALYFIVYNLVVQIIGFARSAPEIWRQTSGAIRDFVLMVQRYLSRFPLPVRQWSDTFFENLSDYVGNWLQNATAAATVAESAAETGISAGFILISIIMGILASYFFLADKDYIVGLLEKYIPGRIMARWDLVFRTMKSAVGGYFIAQLKIMVFMYVEVFVGLLILGVRYSFLIAFLIALLDFLPFFGTGAVMWPWAIIRFIERDYRTAVGLLIVWIVGQAVRQLIQPKLVGDSIGLKPLPTLFFLYIGFRAGGALGLILAVPVGMAVINLYRAGIFSNFKYSLILLFRTLDRIRRFTPEELRAEGIEPERTVTVTAVPPDQKEGRHD